MKIRITKKNEWCISKQKNFVMLNKARKILFKTTANGERGLSSSEMEDTETKGGKCLG